MTTTAAPAAVQTWDVTFSIYGSNPTPAWYRAIVSTVRVQASSREEALEAAKAQCPTLREDPAAVRSVGVVIGVR